MSLEFITAFHESALVSADDVVDTEPGLRRPPTRSLPPKHEGWIKNLEELKPGDLEEFLSGKRIKRNLVRRSRSS